MEAGLVFVCTKDSLGQIILSITKESYNYIGFYLTTTVTGSLSTKVFLFDNFRSEHAKWLPPNATLEHIYTHPIVKKVTKKKFRGTEKLEILENFKLAIASALSYHAEYPLVPALYKLFGHRCDPICIENKTDQWCGQTATDLVNNTFKNLSIFDKFKNVDTKNYEHVSSDPLAQMATLFTRLPSSDLNLNTYLSDLTYFENSIEVDLTPFQLEIKEINEGIQKYNSENYQTIVQMFMVFNGQVNTNSEFAETIKKSLELTKKNRSSKIKDTLENLESTLNNNKTSETGKLIETIKGFILKLKNI
jgi:hypothetical protein